MDTDTLAPVTPLALGPDLTIAQAASCRDALVDALCATTGDLVLDLQGVTDIDSAGLQLLLATRRSVAERGAALQLTGVSGTAAQALAVFGLDSSLDTLVTRNGARA
jgi:anti-sigma B factor antagonist